jgi:hypothetical protein
MLTAADTTGAACRNRRNRFDHPIKLLDRYPSPRLCQRRFLLAFERPWGDTIIKGSEWHADISFALLVRPRDRTSTIAL